MAPWADVLYACDFAWWKAHQGVPAYKGCRITLDKGATNPYPDLRQIKYDKSSDALLMSKFGTIGWGGNSGFGAINLAVQFGAAAILLVGFDMRLDRGLHWHGAHGAGLNNPMAKNVERWRRAVDGCKPVLDALGIRTFNCSPDSALTAYPKMTFDEALAKC